MNFEIVEIKNRSIYQDERLVLKVLKDTDLCYCIIIHTNYINNGKNIKTVPRHTKWFSSQPLKVNDLGPWK